MNNIVNRQSHKNGVILVFATMTLLAAGPRCAAEAASVPQPRLMPLSGISAGPFTAADQPVIAWSAGQDTPFRCEFARDEAFVQPVLRVTGRGGGLRVPAGTLVSGQRYYMRVTTWDSAAAAWRPWPEAAWFVMDRRYLGYSQVSPHHYPFGKNFNRNLARDRRGRLHLLFGALIDNHRQLFYAFSNDDGQSWTVRHMPQLDSNRKANMGCLALSPDEQILHTAWIEWDTFPGDLVCADIDITQEPVLISDPRAITTGAIKCSVCTMPAIAAAPDGTVHAVWNLLPTIHEDEAMVAYANNCGGWREPIPFYSRIGSTVAPTLAVDGSGGLHMLWEGGQYRYSPDGGRTWNPPLESDPLLVFGDLSLNGQRARQSALAAVPDSPRMFAVSVVEDVAVAVDGRPIWTGPINIHDVWLREITGGQLGAAERVHRLDLPRRDADSARSDPRGIGFLIYPTASASSRGEVAVLWQETRVLDQGKSIRIRGRIRAADGQWGGLIEAGAWPQTASVAPHLAPGFDDKLDLVWAEAENYDWRVLLGNDMDEDFPLYNVFHGLFYTALDLSGIDLRQQPPVGPLSLAVPDWPELESQLATDPGARIAGAAHGRLIQWRDRGLPPYQPHARDHVPNMVTLARRSAAMPTGTPTRSPTPRPTRTPSPTTTNTPAPTATMTPVPAGTQTEFFAIADTHVDQEQPDSNFGNNLALMLYHQGGIENRLFLRFPVGFGGQSVVITHAELVLTLMISTGVHLQPMNVLGAWDEAGVTWNNAPAIADIGLPEAIEPPPGEQLRCDVTELVADWAARGGAENGVALVQEINHWNHSAVYSRDCPAADQRPLLRIYYLVASPTPNQQTPTPTATTTGPSATPTPAPTQAPPSITPSPTSPATVDLIAEIRVNQPLFSAGDHLLVQGRLLNRGIAVSAIEVVLLDYHGFYAFWPSWGEQFDGVAVELQPGEEAERKLLEFDWPANAGVYDNIRIWHAAVNHEATAIVGDAGYCDFSAI